MWVTYITGCLIMSIGLLLGRWIGIGNRRSVYFKEINSDKIPYWQIAFYGEKVIDGIMQLLTTEADKQRLQTAVKSMTIVAKDKAFNAYGDEFPGSMKIFVSKNLHVFFVGDKNWKRCLARALVHASKYALTKDGDADMRDAAWFAYAIKQVEEDVD